MRKHRWAGILVAALLVVAGCGASSSKAEKVKVDGTPAGLRAAAAATLDKSASQVTFTMTFGAEGQSLALTGTGKLDAAGKRAEISFDGAPLASKLGSDVPAEAADAFKDIRVVMDSTTMYMRFPLLAQMAGGGKEWVKVDLSSAGGLGDLVGGGGGGALGTDPSGFLRFLEGTGDVQRVGSEDVGGAPTTRYSGTFTLQQALDQSGDKAAVQRMVDQLKLPDSFFATRIPFDAWVDGDGLVRKVHITMDLAALGASDSPAGAGVDMTMELGGFGEPVDITVPSDDQTLDFSQLLRNLPGRETFSSAASEVN